jgi:hypothetical protein
MSSPCARPADEHKAVARLPCTCFVYLEYTTAEHASYHLVLTVFRRGSIIKRFYDKYEAASVDKRSRKQFADL